MLGNVAAWCQLQINNGTNLATEFKKQILRYGCCSPNTQPGWMLFTQQPTVWILFTLHQACPDRKLHELQMNYKTAIS